MLRYTTFRLVLLVLCGSLLFKYVSTEDCRYQLLLPSSCYITSGSPSDAILPCSIETCSAASYKCVYTGTGQDFTHLVFNCNTTNRSNVNCSFRRITWSLYGNLAALFNVCLINEDSCNIINPTLSNCVLNRYSATSTQSSTKTFRLTTSKVLTSLGSVLNITTSSDVSTEITTKSTSKSTLTASNVFTSLGTNKLSTQIKLKTENTTFALFAQLTMSTSSSSELIQVIGDKSLFIGLTAGFGTASIIFINVLIVACLCYKIRKSRNTNSNLRSFQTPILVISESQNSDTFSQGCTADLVYHQPYEQNQKNCFAVHNYGNSSSSNYSEVIDIPNSTVTHFNTLSAQQATSIEDIDNSYSIASLRSVECENKTCSNVNRFISEHKEHYGNKSEVQTQDVNQYSKLFDVSRERNAEYNDFSNVQQIIQYDQDKRDLA